MGCDRNWLKPLFKAIQNSIKLYELRDYSYILPVPSSEKSKALNHTVIVLHIILIIIAITSAVYINIFATNYLFPLWTLSLFASVNIFIITLSLYVIIMFAVHISIMAPFLSPPSKLKYTDKAYWCIILRSFFTKSISFPILFSISPLILLYVLLFVFIFGNSPIIHFEPNMKCWHDFYLHLHHDVIPQLVDRFHGNKSISWIQKFVYLLFNCVVLDEYISKKSNPQSPTRVSFVNLMAGNDVEKVLKRVTKHLENMIVLYDKHGNLNENIFECNKDSWRHMFACDDNNTIQYNFQYILCALFPFHFLLFWVYFLLHNNPSFVIDFIPIIIIAGTQLLFYILAISLLWLHLKYTVKTKPQLLYTWSNFHLMDFYCSFHDDDEQESFKTKLEGYTNSFATEYRTSAAIRKNNRVFRHKWIADMIISFCCVMDDKQYDQHSYNTIMSIISRNARAQHIKQCSSKQAILRGSMHLHLGGSFSSDHRAGASYEFSPPNVPRMYSNGYSQDSMGSIQTQSYKHGAVPPKTPEEEKEKDNGGIAYYHLSEDSNKSTSLIPMFEMNPLSEVNEMPGIDEGDEDDDEKEERVKDQLNVTPAPHAEISITNSKDSELCVV